MNNRQHTPRQALLALRCLAPCLGMLLTAGPVLAQSQPMFPNSAPTLLAQAASPASPPPVSREQPQPFDLTPVTLPERGAAFAPMQNFKTSALYYLPARMYFNATVENSLRLETNVLQTHKRYHSDMIYRTLPNVTLGYALSKTTRVAANYFFFRDQYMDNNALLSRNIHSVGVRADHDFLLTPRTTLTTSLMARELFITRNVPLNDILPSVTIVHRVGNAGVIYGSVLGQIRWTKFLNEFQEGDQFYSFGGVYRTPKWTFIGDTTLVDNFGNRNLRGGAESNHVIVMTLEAGRKISQRLPLTAFVRAEPIFNIGNNKRTGYSGVNFRIFGGIRAEISKPAIFPVRLRG